MALRALNLTDFTCNLPFVVDARVLLNNSRALQRELLIEFKACDIDCKT